MRKFRFKRLRAGHYETPDGRFRIINWNKPPGGNRPRGSIAELDAGEWEFVCELLTLSDARKYFAGESVFILS